MKKKSIVLLMILTLSMFININRVEASVTVDGTTWEKVCKYNSGEYSIQLYSKNGTTMIIDSRFGSNYKIYYNQPIAIELANEKKTYLTQNSILASDGKCPTTIYAYIDDKVTYWINVIPGFGQIFSIINQLFDKRAIIYATSSQKHWYDGAVSTGNSEDIYIRESGNNDLPDINPGGETTCDGIVDESLKNLINKYLGYIHILIPILILALGVFDFFKAMIASKEEEMKKAQKNFIIRLVSGVLIFLAPTIVNMIIDMLNVGACLID